MDLSQFQSSQGWWDQERLERL